MIKNIKKAVHYENPNEIFIAENAKRKKKLLEKPEIISDVRKKIDSILKPPKINEKSKLLRIDKKKKTPIPESNLIVYEEVKSPEAKQLLKMNKRKFGEDFKSELIVPSKKIIKHQRSLSKKTTTKKNTKPKILHIDPLSARQSGTVSQLIFPYVSKHTLVSEEREMLKSILKDKINIPERFTVQKYISSSHNKFLS